MNLISWWWRRCKITNLLRNKSYECKQQGIQCDPLSTHVKRYFMNFQDSTWFGRIPCVIAFCCILQFILLHMYIFKVLMWLSWPEQHGWVEVATGPGATAGFSDPARVATDASGNVYVSDQRNLITWYKRLAIAALNVLRPWISVHLPLEEKV